MSNRYGQPYRNGGYGNLSPPAGGDDEYDPYGEGYGSDRYAPPPPRQTNNPRPRPPPSASARSAAAPPPRSAQRAVQETHA